MNLLNLCYAARTIQSHTEFLACVLKRYAYTSNCCLLCAKLQGDELRSTRKECSARATKLQKLSEEKTRASQLAVEADQLKVS
jgi:hypothetical protein